MLGPISSQPPEYFGSNPPGHCPDNFTAWVPLAVHQMVPYMNNAYNGIENNLPGEVGSIFKILAQNALIDTGLAKEYPNLATLAKEMSSIAKQIDKGNPPPDSELLKTLNSLWDALQTDFKHT